VADAQYAFDYPAKFLLDHPDIAEVLIKRILRICHQRTNYDRALFLINSRIGYWFFHQQIKIKFPLINQCFIIFTRL
jgi:hypothetical protein